MFKKSYTPWNKGHNRVKDSRINIVCKTCNKIFKDYLSNKKKYCNHSCASKFTKNALGHKHSKETIKKMSGKNNHGWQGGISQNPYPREFNYQLRLKIRTRDNFTCCLCSKTEREELEELNRVLCVNHIDFNKNNCSEKNLNTLCTRCNIKINREREYWTNYFQTK